MTWNIPLFDATGKIKDARVGSVYAFYAPTKWVTAAAGGSGVGTEGDPWTLAQAMANAVAGDIVQVGPGTYTGSNTDDNFDPSWRAANSGSPGKPIIFFARYPAVRYVSNRSQLSNGVTTDRGGCPTFGCGTGDDYIYWDGFYVDENTSNYKEDMGPAVLNGCTGSELRRCLIKGDVAAGEGGSDNHCSFRMEASDGVAIRDCEAYDNYSGLNAYNGSCVVIYTTYNFVVENNHFYNSDGGVFLKGDSAVQAIHTATVRNNYIHDVARGITPQHVAATAGPGVDGTYGARIYQNIVEDCEYGIIPRGDTRAWDPSDCVIANNLIIGSTWGLYTKPGTHDAMIHRNNLIIDCTFAQQAEDVTAWPSGIDSDYNMYSGFTTFGRLNYTNYTLATWVSTFGDETNSVDDDPEFVNKATGNYKLDTGSPALGAGTDYLSLLGGDVGAAVNYGPYVLADQSDEIGVRTDPSYPVPSYIPNKFVAPWADVTNATSDEDVVNGTTYANANSEGTPCTLAEAAANCAAGDQIQVAPGVYTSAQGTSGAWEGAFGTNNPGSSGSEIVFFAKFPAADNVGNEAYWSEMQSTGSPASCWSFADDSSPNEYVIIDGFYFDQAVQLPVASKGTVVMNGADYCQMRRCVVDHPIESRSGDNFDSVWVQGSVGCVVSDNLFRGGRGGTDPGNVCCIKTYATTDLIVEYNTFDDVACPLWFKGPTTGPGNHGTIRFNRINDVHRGMSFLYMEEARDTNIYQNLFTGISQQNAIQIRDEAASTNDLNFYNNTLVVECDLDSEDIWGIISFRLGGTNITGIEIYNNIIIADTGSTEPLVQLYQHSTFSAFFDQFDYNLYYDVPTSPEWGFDAGYDTTFANWQTTANAELTGAEANSLYENPTFDDTFDYKLTAGAQNALTASDIGGPVGCWITGNEDIGIRANPSY